MATFTYNDMQFTLEANGGAWDLTRQQPGGPAAVAAVGLFPGLSEAEAAGKALALAKTVYPVGIRTVGPDVTHPNTIGDLKIVGPDVTHPNFIYWNKDSAACPRDL